MSKLILEKYAKYDSAGRPVGIPSRVKMTPSKFDREVGDKMRFEGVEYIVVFTYPDSASNAEVRAMFDYRVKLWKFKQL